MNKSIFKNNAKDSTFSSVKITKGLNRREHSVADLNSIASIPSANEEAVQGKLRPHVVNQLSIPTHESINKTFIFQKPTSTAGKILYQN